ncbi:hypothetical protein HPB47_004654 [Ixodes persulcatus]|uniref:Uncharacterized protein n=1 Tax=Ixodes persulcatus TaxID=34615 RepID=A0AC60PF34_IXOPE|nr:hypothetical protein HPB47_004654 [Ixodes persulcatus]
MLYGVIPEKTQGAGCWQISLRTTSLVVANDSHSPEILLAWRVAADTMGSDHFAVFNYIIGLQRPVVHEISVIHWDRFRDNLGRSTRPLLEAISDVAKKATTKATVPASFRAPDLTIQNLCVERRRAQQLLQRKGGVTLKTLFNRMGVALRRYAKKKMLHAAVGFDLLFGGCKHTSPPYLEAYGQSVWEKKRLTTLAEDFATLYAAAVIQPNSRCHADKTPFCMDAPFTESELGSVLRACKRQGHRDQTGSRRKCYRICQIHVSRFFFPVGRLAWVVPVLKSGKPARDLLSYRPVFHTYFVDKLFERLVHARLIWSLKEHHLLPLNMTGFRSRLSAQDNILDIAAFDNVKPASVLAQLTSWGVTRRVHGFLEGFLSNRSIQADKLERLHRAGLRTSLGVPRSAKNKRAYEEARSLPSHLQASQRLLLQILRLGETHPGHKTANTPPQALTAAAQDQLAPRYPRLLHIYTDGSVDRVRLSITADFHIPDLQKDWSARSNHMVSSTTTEMLATTEAAWQLLGHARARSPTRVTILPWPALVGYCVVVKTKSRHKKRTAGLLPWQRRSTNQLFFFELRSVARGRASPKQTTTRRGLRRNVGDCAGEPSGLVKIREAYLTSTTCSDWRGLRGQGLWLDA